MIKTMSVSTVKATVENDLNLSSSKTTISSLVENFARISN